MPGIVGTSKVHIPACTSSHTQMCLKGKGIKRLDQPGYGDQILNIKIGMPKWGRFFIDNYFYIINSLTLILIIYAYILSFKQRK